MPLYEHVLIARPDISPQQVEALVEDLTRSISELGGTVAKSEYWGLRNLTFRINKNRKGHYALFNIDAPAEVLHELERRQRINEDVMRFLSVRVEAFPEGASPVVAKRDRDEKRRSRREGGPLDGDTEGDAE
jgi:small subunit ribosomal protein S6